MINRRAFLQQASSTLAVWGATEVLIRGQAARTQVFYDPGTLRHATPAGHPETPQRMDAVMTAVRGLERQGQVALAAPRAATDDDLLLVHTREYVNKVRAEVAAGRRTLSTGDTDISPGSMAAALGAAGTVMSGVDAVVSGGARTAFCALRPPGHHASQARGMGFCLFNNIAIGARHAQRRHGVGRVLVVDWDVHHGNGTQDVFWSDGSVLFFDVHQHPWYPGTGGAEEKGDGKGRGLIINNPFPAGSGRKEIVTAFREVLVPAAGRFKPELVMISAGFDSRRGDPLGRFTLSDEDFAELTEIVVGIARQHAGGRLVSVLEGGYALAGLTSAVTAHLTKIQVSLA
jgi:acetoin utilization deacetylase AcuC-like enzyme